MEVKGLKQKKDTSVRAKTTLGQPRSQAYPCKLVGSLGTRLTFGTLLLVHNVHVAEEVGIPACASYCLITVVSRVSPNGRLKFTKTGVESLHGEAICTHNVYNTHEP